MQKVEKHHIKDYEGDFLYLGAAMNKLADPAQGGDPSRLPDPSLSQIRNAVTEFCVLPLGSQPVWDHSPLKSIVDGDKYVNKVGTPTLLSGSPGTGKKMLVHAICNETGANLFNLTPSNTEGKYPGKKGPGLMVYTVLKVARALPPSVVWIDDAEMVFGPKQKKGGGGDAPGRIMKDLVNLVSHKSDKKRLLDINDRVLVLGTSSNPKYVEKPKDLKKFVCGTNGMGAFFSKTLFLPLPDYPSRQMMWTRSLQKKGVDRPNPDEIQTLSAITKYYSSGSIVNVVNRTLTQRRVERLARKPFSANELIGQLAKEEPVYHEDDKELRDWYLKNVLNMGPPKTEGGGKEKKGGKGKKKK